MDHGITVVGIGPGHPDYLLPVAAAAIRSARVLAGGRRALESFAAEWQETMVVDGNIPSFIEEMRARLLREDVTVLVSGDPGYFSLLDALRREFPNRSIQVVPGLSSFQLAFSRIGIPWQDAVLLSFHGREPAEEKLLYREGGTLSILSGGMHNPAVIAERLLQGGWPADTCVWLCRNLSYETEDIACLPLCDVAKTSDFVSCVMVVKG